MLNPEQTKYIDDLRTSGIPVTDDNLRSALVGAGWPPHEVSEAMQRFHGLTPLPSSVPELTVPKAPIPLPAVQPQVPQPQGKESLAKEPITEEKPKASVASVTSSVVPMPGNVSFPKKKILTLLGVLLLCVSIASGVYFGRAYLPFLGSTLPVLTSNTILTYTFTKFSEIETANYNFGGTLTIEDRDVDARSFDELSTISEEEIARYNRDQDRFRDIQNIIDTLKTKYRTDVELPYPGTLSGLIKSTNDPLGKPYRYVPSRDGKTYTITVTFETELAARVAHRYSRGDSAGEMSATTGALTVTIGSEEYFSTYGFDGKPEQPRLFGFSEFAELERMIPNTMSTKFSLEGTINNRDATPLDARFAFNGEASFGDALFAFGAEGLKKGGEYYAVVHKMPSFFSAISQVRDRWIHITESDLQNYGLASYYEELIPGANTEREQLGDAWRQQFKIFLETADQVGLLTVVAGPVKDTRNSVSLMKYDVAINREALLPFYKSASEKAASLGERAILRYDDQIEAYLKSDEFKKSFDYIKDNVTISLWYNRAGFPVRFEISIRYVPSGEALVLKGKQVRLVLGLDLFDINKALQVEPPKESISIDELMMLITGKSHDEVLNDHQIQNIRTLQQALDSYRGWSGYYPESLADLTKKRGDVERGATSTPVYDAYIIFLDAYATRTRERPFIARLPNDVHTGSLYGYTRNGDDYTLTYEMKVPTFTTSKDPRMYYEFSYKKDSFAGENSGSRPFDTQGMLLVPKYFAGKNVATKSIASQAQLETTDTDQDGLSDSLETIFGTKQATKDTDSDGFDDGEEIQSNSNPLGPGNLDFKTSESLFF